MKWDNTTNPSGRMDVCRADLVTPLITLTSGGPEAPLAGRPVHLRYRPAKGYGQQLAQPRSERSESNFDWVYEFDLAPFWVPYPGQVWLEGGARDQAYSIDWLRVECAPMPGNPGRVMTLRELDTTGRPIPLGASLFSVSEDCTLILTAAGENVSLRCIAGQVMGASNWAATVGSTVAASAGTVQLVKFEIVL